MTAGARLADTAAALPSAPEALARRLMRSTAAREDIRDLILDAADRLLASRGYKKMTVEDLANEVGIGKGTIYLHFPSKEEVVLSHIDRVVERVKKELRRLAATDGPAPARLREMLVARVMIRFDAVQHYTESISDLLAALRPGLLARRRRHFQEEAEIIASVLEGGRRAGALAFRDGAHPTARALLTATNALLPYSLSTRELGQREDVRAETGRVVALLLEGLVARPD